jgi:hypothetical protein
MQKEAAKKARCDIYTYTTHVRWAHGEHADLRIAAAAQRFMFQSTIHFSSCSPILLHVLVVQIEEFGIYLNYVRKLSFEETPDYDFLRDLFTKALKSINEVEDGVYDWMLLNNGKGWEADMDVSLFNG